MAVSKGMVQVSGSTYRIVECGALHEVVRLLDDRRVGAFRHGAELVIVDSELPNEALLEIATHALRSARLCWSPRPRKPRAAAVRHALGVVVGAIPFLSLFR